MDPTPRYIPEWRINLSLWFLRRKEILKKVAFFSFFFLDFLLIYIAGIRLIQYTVDSFKHESLMQLLVQGNNIAWQSIHETFNPKSPRVTVARYVRAEEGFYDLIARVVNVNEKWGAQRVRFHFVANGRTLGTQTTSLLPGEGKYVFYFRFPSLQPPRGVQVVIDSVDWVHHPSFLAMDARNEISADNIQLVRGKGGYDRVQFDAANNSPFTFWQAGFAVVAFNQDIPVAAHYVTIEEWESRSRVPVEAVWFYRLPFVSRVEVYPDIPFLDPNSIKPIWAEEGSSYGIQED